MLSGISAEMTTSTPFRDLLHPANLRHGTGSFTSPPKEGVLRISFTLKNPTASTGFEPANFGTKGQHATPRPPKPSMFVYERKNKVGNLRKFVVILSVHLLETFCPARILNMKFGKRRSEEKLYCLENDVQAYSCL